jgi:CMP/dCMP kinase
MSFVVAIDGPAAAGKGSLSRALAQRFGFDCLDTGLLYRAVARQLLDEGSDPSNAERATAVAQALRPEHLADSERLRGEAIGQAASISSSIAGVRAALFDFQRQFAANPPGGKGAILDGRDIGTAIFPEAQAKLWVTASAETRASRRHAEAVAGGDSSQSYEQILDSIRRRDERERDRPISPLLPAADAVLVDTSELSIEQTREAAIKVIDAAWLAHCASEAAKAKAQAEASLAPGRSPSL